MDVMLGLSAASQAIKLARELQEVDRDLDLATYKLQIAELLGSLAEVKISLTDAKTELHDKDQEIKRLSEVIESMKLGDTCPICEEGRMKVTEVIPHPTSGVFGHQEHTLTCQNSNCPHTEKRRVDRDQVTGAKN